MKDRLAWSLIITLSVILTVLTGCANPQPLPVAPTSIPTLVPATLPPLATATVRPAALGVTFPSRQPSAQMAGALYQQHCANCHGVDGQGAVPDARNFSDADYMRGQTPVRFYQIISDGRNAMPGWQDQLSADERWDLTYYTWHLATPPEMLEQGEATYQRDCATCHGVDGKGVVPDTPDFTNPEWMAVRAPSDFFEVVTEGRGTMPSWQGRLSADERWAAIEYLRTFSYVPAAGPATAKATDTSPAASPTAEPTATSAPPTATTPPPSEAVETPTPEAGATPPTGDATNGEQLYVENSCGACHGVAGEGGLGPGLAGIEDDDAELFDAIENGRTGTAMMAFGDQLSAEEIRDLIAFIRQLE